MQRALNPELKRTINRHAHVLAAMSFAAIRADLEQQARKLSREGIDLDTIVKAIEGAGLRADKQTVPIK
jgi:hypothetical protein